jgi:hypothetical protein
MSTYKPYFQTKKNDSVDQEKTTLRVKLDELSANLKKLAMAFIGLETDFGAVLLESELSNKLVSSSVDIQSLESLEGEDGEVFFYFLNNLINITKNIGTVSDWKNKKMKAEDFSKVLSMLKSTEEGLKELVPIVSTIDDRRKKFNFETFGGTIQKLTNILEEKRHLILRALPN